MLVPHEVGSDERDEVTNRNGREIYDLNRVRKGDDGHDFDSLMKLMRKQITNQQSQVFLVYRCCFQINKTKFARKRQKRLASVKVQIRCRKKKVGRALYFIRHRLEGRAL